MATKKKELNIELHSNKKPTKKEIEIYNEVYDTVFNMVIKLRESNVSKDSIKEVVEASLDGGLAVTREEILMKMTKLQLMGRQ